MALGLNQHDPVKYTIAFWAPGEPGVRSSSIFLRIRPVRQPAPPSPAAPEIGPPMLGIRQRRNGASFEIQGERGPKHNSSLPAPEGGSPPPIGQHGGPPGPVIGIEADVKPRVRFHHIPKPIRTVAPVVVIFEVFHGGVSHPASHDFEFRTPPAVFAPVRGLRPVAPPPPHFRSLRAAGSVISTPRRSLQRPGRLSPAPPRASPPRPVRPPSPASAPPGLEGRSAQWPRPSAGPCPKPAIFFRPQQPAESPQAGIRSRLHCSTQTRARQTDCQLDPVEIIVAPGAAPGSLDRDQAKQLAPQVGLDIPEPSSSRCAGPSSASGNGARGFPPLRYRGAR